MRSTVGNTEAQLQTNYELKQKVNKMEKSLSQKIQETLYAVGDNLSKVIFGVYFVLYCILVLFCLFCFVTICSSNFLVCIFIYLLTHQSIHSSIL
jgi:hypothetical protein